MCDLLAHFVPILIKKKVFWVYQVQNCLMQISHLLLLVVVGLFHISNKRFLKLCMAVYKGFIHELITVKYRYI